MIRNMVLPISLALFAAFLVPQLALLVYVFAPSLAWTPLAAFLLAGALVPAFPCFPFYLPITCRGDRRLRQVGLSFDDGPDPLVTPWVLDLLDRFQVKAAFFLIGTKAEAQPELVREILARGHEVGNHSWHHDPLVTLKGKRRLRAEVEGGQRILQGFGITPLAFRPPVGITNPPLWRILLDNGMFCCNFSCRAWDAGNRRIRNLAQRLLQRVRPGDLVLLHDTAPRGGSVDDLIAELEAFLGGLKAKELAVVPVSTLLGRPIMTRQGWSGRAAEAFYEALAPGYDHEQFETGVAIARRRELELFEAALSRLLPTGRERVLEIGAGTGIFTLRVASRAADVLAVDLSRAMLAGLESKAAAAGVMNIRTLAGDAERAELTGPFDLVCAFSALEYMADLPALLHRIAPEVAPGGRIYLLTARRSLFRFFTQLGNAMRQGLWLRARSRREMARMLTAAGFEVIGIRPHLLRCVINGGMLLEVEARKT